MVKVAPLACQLEEVARGVLSVTHVNGTNMSQSFMVVDFNAILFRNISHIHIYVYIGLVCTHAAFRHWSYIRRKAAVCLWRGCHHSLLEEIRQFCQRRIKTFWRHRKTVIICSFLQICKRSVIGITKIALVLFVSQLGYSFVVHSKSTFHIHIVYTVRF